MLQPPNTPTGVSERVLPPQTRAASVLEPTNGHIPFTGAAGAVPVQSLKPDNMLQVTVTVPQLREPPARVPATDKHELMKEVPRQHTLLEPTDTNEYAGEGQLPASLVAQKLAAAAAADRLAASCARSASPSARAAPAHAAAAQSDSTFISQQTQTFCTAGEQ